MRDRILRFVALTITMMSLAGCTKSPNADGERTKSAPGVVLTEKDDLSKHVGQRVTFSTKYEGFIDGVGFLDCGGERVAIPYRPVPEPNKGQRITITGKLGICEGFSSGSKMHNVIVESWESFQD